MLKESKETIVFFVTFLLLVAFQLGGGRPTGLPLATPMVPTLANFFLATVERKLLAQNLDCSPKLYVTFADDIFAIFEEEKSCSKFLHV